MSQPAEARTRSRRSTRPAIFGLVSAAVIGTVGYQAASAALSPSEVSGGDDSTVQLIDGPLPPGVTAFDDTYRGVAELDPELLVALRAASTDANDEGIELNINSGWRSREHQDQLLREAVATYGSEDEAARWVATPDTSPHVTGDAVDIGPYDAILWLSEHGGAYGLCQIYGNESWHYELRPEAVDQGCPPMYADPTQDPRMQH